MRIAKNVIAGCLLLPGCLFLSSFFSLPSNKPAPVTHTIQIAQMKFLPSELKVKKGDKVVFVNKDMVVHNVTDQSGKVRLSPDIAAGKSWTMVVSNQVNYYCSFHPVMKGKILIK
jgi:plastocyanin